MWGRQQCVSELRSTPYPVSLSFPATHADATGLLRGATCQQRGYKALSVVCVCCCPDTTTAADQTACCHPHRRRGVVAGGRVDVRTIDEGAAWLAAVGVCVRLEETASHEGSERVADTTAGPEKGQISTRY